MTIRYYGYNGLATGYGKAADEMVQALRGAGAEVEVIPLTSDAALTQRLGGDPDAVIVHALPFHAQAVYERARLALVGGKIIAYTTWEAASAAGDDIGDAMRGFDQVWVPSVSNKISVIESVGRHGSNRVTVVPHSFDEDSLVVRRQPGAVSGGDFTFYTIGAWNGRKNLDGLVTAWARAFTKHDPVTLFIHSVNAPESALELAKLKTGVGVRDDLAQIEFSRREISDAEIHALHANLSCYVTATRGEAFNLPMFDAVLAGRPVITTAGTGAEYLSSRVYPDDDLYLYPHPKLVPVRLQPAVDDVSFAPPDKDGLAKVAVSGSHGVTCRHDWLDPSLVDLAIAMKQAARARARTVAYDTDYLVANFGRRAVGALAISLIQKGIP